MKTSECAKYLAALEVSDPKSATLVHVNSNGRSVRTIGVVELPVPNGRKAITRGSKKFKAIMSRHRELMREKANALL